MFVVCHIIRRYISGFLSATKDDPKVTGRQKTNAHEGG